MCGRIVQVMSPDDVAAAMDAVLEPGFGADPAWAPRWNLPPSSLASIVTPNDGGRRLETDPAAVRHAAGGHDEQVGFEVDLGGRICRNALDRDRLDRHAHARRCAMKGALDDAMSHVNGDPPLRERAGQLFRSVAVLERHDGGEHLDERRLGAEIAEVGGKLAANGAATDHDHPLRRKGTGDDLVAAHDQPSVGLEAGNSAHARPGCDHDVICGDTAVLPGCSASVVDERDVDRPVSNERAAPRDQLDAVLLEERFQARVHARHDLVAPCTDCGRVDRKSTRLNSSHRCIRMPSSA